LNLRNFTLFRMAAPSVVAMSLLFLPGCESTPGAGGTPTISPAATPQAVPSANVQKVQAWKDANLLASRADGREALVGGGESMNPVYGDNTMLVVHPIEFSQLKAGMTVVYTGRHGRRVAHQLIKREGKGWRAQGINNPDEDNDLVTPENLIGVVYASLSSEIKD
jgi:phage repressor protein C with HTH and peptisase S24 domain